MEAKDTVIGIGHRRAECEANGIEMSPHLDFVTDVIAEAQAEISFKAGEDKGKQERKAVTDEQIEADEDVANLNYLDGKRDGEAGFNKVVELDGDITAHILQDGEGNWSVESWRIKEWFKKRQANLKEWGINEITQ